MIQLTNINFKYNNKNIINDVNLTINDNELVAFIGKNGSGKSTLAKLISGILKPSSGDIIVNDTNTKDKKLNIELRKNIGIVFQNPENQIIFNNVLDDVSFGMKNIGVASENILPKVQDALAKVNMSNFINSNTFNLSGGEMQRIAIATILAMDPKILVLDEPTTMLDSIGKKDLCSAILDLNKSNYTVLFTTNVINEALIANRIIIINEGYIAVDTTPDEILNNPAILEQYGIDIPDIVKIKRKLDTLGINIDVKDLLV